MSDTRYKNYLDRWKNQNWEEAGERTAKTCLKYLEKWFDFKPKRILDVGSMNGYVMDAFNRMGYDAWGLEPMEYWDKGESPEKVFHMRLDQLRTVNFFDFIWCSEVMEHIPEGMIAKSLKAVRRALAGFAFFTISGDKDADPTHITIKPREWWLEKFDKAGLVYQPDKVAMKGFNFYCFK